MLTKLEATKWAVRLIAGSGVSKVVNDIIKNNTDVDTYADLVKAAIGSLVIGGMIGEAVSKNLDQKMDLAVAKWQEHKTKAEQPKE